MNSLDKAINLFNKVIYYDNKYYHAFNNKGYFNLIIRSNSYEKIINRIGYLQF